MKWSEVVYKFPSLIHRVPICYIEFGRTVSPAEWSRNCRESAQ